MNTLAVALAQLPEGDKFPLADHDKSVFVGWVKDLIDVIACGQTNGCAPGTVEGIAFLAYELLDVIEVFDRAGGES